MSFFGFGGSSNNSSSNNLKKKSINAKDALKNIPDKAVVEAKFKVLMDDMGIKEQHRGPMNSKSVEEKWIMISLHQELNTAQNAMSDTPQYFVHCLQSDVSAKLLQQLAVFLRIKSVSWVGTFLEMRGLDLIFEVFIASENRRRTKTDVTYLVEVIQCLTSILNTEPGLLAFLNSKDAKKAVAIALAIADLSIRTQILYLLASLCHYSEEGFWLSLDVFTEYKTMKREKARFSDMVQSLTFINTAVASVQMETDKRFFMDYLVSCMMFFNALIFSPNSETTQREIQKELVVLGLADAVKHIKETCAESDETLVIQLDVFLDELDQYYSNERSKDSSQESMNSQLKEKIEIQQSTIRALEEQIQKLQSQLERIQDDNKDGADNARIEYNKKLGTIRQEIEKLLSSLGHDKDSKYQNLLLDIFGETNTSGIMSVEEFDKKVKLEIETMKAKYTNEIEELRVDLDNLKNGIIANLPRASGMPPNNGQGPILIPPPPPPPPGFLPLQTKQDNSTANVPLPPPPPPGIGGPPPPPPPPGMGGPPPPPPPPGMGGPPPPPPPPGMGGPPPPPGMGGPPPPPGMGGPPPPPGMGGFGKPGVPGLPALNNPIPKVQMKNFHWTPIPKTAVAKTIFIKENIAQNTAKLLKDINTEELESLFSAKETKQKDKTEKVEEKKPELISFIDPNKSRNASLILGGLRMSTEDIREAILKLDENKLSLQHVVSIRSFMLSPEEFTAIKEFNGDLSTLNLADRFFKLLEDIPRLDTRLECWNFKRGFETRLSEIKEGVKTLVNGTKQITTSKKFLKFLEIVLAIGNYLNGQNKQKGNAYGFKLGALNKLRDTKTKDNSSTLLHYIVELIERSHPPLLSFYGELPSVESAHKVIISSLQSEISDLKKGLTTIKQELTSLAKIATPEDNFIEVMTAFVEKSEPMFNDVESGFTQALKGLDEAADMYGEDKKSFKPEEFFKDLDEFCKDFQRAYTEIVERRKREEKEKEREKIAMLRKASVKDKGADSANATEGLMEGIQNSLRDGTAYRNRRTNTMSPNPKSPTSPTIGGKK